MPLTPRNFEGCCFPVTGRKCWGACGRPLTGSLGWGRCCPVTGMKCRCVFGCYVGSIVYILNHSGVASRPLHGKKTQNNNFPKCYSVLPEQIHLQHRLNTSCFHRIMEIEVTTVLQHVHLAGTQSSNALLFAFARDNGRLSSKP